jgi:hypothetical protein
MAQSTAAMTSPQPHHQPPALARRSSLSGGSPAPHNVDEALCSHTLTQVMSWLGVPDLAGGAGLVCKRWNEASECTEVWRR